VALFGATGFLGRYVSSGLGESLYFMIVGLLIAMHVVWGRVIYDVILRES
jgi:ABC-type molybdate transport system permease subunit